MPARKPPPDWSRRGVRKQLKEQAKETGAVAAQVFFRDSISADRLSDTARTLIDAAAKRLGRRQAVAVGKVHSLAKSVSVKGDPEVIAELGKAAEVRTVLPSSVDDVYPKPLKRKTVT